MNLRADWHQRGLLCGSRPNLNLSVCWIYIQHTELHPPTGQIVSFTAYGIEIKSCLCGQKKDLGISRSFCSSLNGPVQAQVQKLDGVMVYYSLSLKRKHCLYDKKQSINMVKHGCIWQYCLSKLHTGKSKVSSLHIGALQNHLYANTAWFMQNMRFSILWHVTCILFCWIVSPRLCSIRLILRCSLEFITCQT